MLRRQAGCSWRYPSLVCSAYLGAVPGSVEIGHVTSEQSLRVT